MARVKDNIVFSGLLSAANYIFPLLTYPYVSRVLGVDNIGICGFVDNLVELFILFSMMGTSIAGVRAIAMAKRNTDTLDKVFGGILFVNGIATLLAAICLALSPLFVEELSSYRDMIWLGVFKLVFNFFLIEWFYRGLEDFRYITVRSIATKIVYVGAVFIFVKDADDYCLYYALGVAFIGVNALLNCIHSRRFVRMRRCDFCPDGFLRPFMILGLYLLSTSMYTTFNSIYLGFTTDDTQVGYYSTATKIYSIIIALYGAVTTAMFPRLSALASERRMDDFRILISKSLSVLFTFAIPAVAWTFVMAPQIVRVVSGVGYEGAVMPLRIVTPLILVIGMAQILVVQILMPLGKDRLILSNSLVGAGCGIILNIILVGRMASVGSAVVWLVSETFILVLSILRVNHDMLSRSLWALLAKSIAVYSPLALLLILLRDSVAMVTPIALLLISFLVSICYMVVSVALFFRDSEAWLYMRRLFKRLLSFRK